jgi:transposase
MEPTIIGIDVSKDRLDVHVRPSGESFTVARNAAGLDQLVERSRALTPELVALEATGGFEVIAAGLDEAVRASPAWREAEDLLASVPGIGKTIARTLRGTPRRQGAVGIPSAELPELGSLDRREIAALAGLAPFTRQSGQWRGKAAIAGGRASVRAALFLGAMVARRHNPALRAFADRLLAAGKPRMVALIAVARKLLTTLNATLRDRRPWQAA